MNKPIVSTGFSKLADPNLLTKTGQILEMMSGNISYPNPTPTLAVVQTSAKAFSDGLTAAADGGKSLTAAKNSARAALIDLLGSLALYVQQNCNSDLATLLSSGFDARKEPQPAGILPAPTGATLANGTLAGTLDLRSKPVSNAKSYEAQQTTDITKEESWESVGTFTSTRIPLEALTPGTTYWARVRAIGASGPGAWCDPVSAMAL